MTIRLSIIMILVFVAAVATAAAQRTAPRLPLLLSRDSVTIDCLQQSHVQPLIVIRFLGSLCGHCMQQLASLNKSAAAIVAARARVIAFSSNPPWKCAEVTRDYRIDTSAISICCDTDDACSRALGTSITESDGSITELHGFLVIDKGLIIFEHYSATPLMGFQGVIELLASRAALR